MKKDKKTKYLEIEHQIYNKANNKANNSVCLKDWTKDFSSLKFKDASSANIAKNVSITSRSSNDDKLDAFFDNLITIEELADYIGVSQKTIRNWISLRSIPFLRVGKKTFFSFEKINGWLKTKEFEPCL